MKRSRLGLCLKIYAPLNFIVFMLVLLYLNSDWISFIMPPYVTVLAVIVITLSSVFVYAIGEILCSLYEIKHMLRNINLEKNSLNSDKK